MENGERNTIKVDEYATERRQENVVEEKRIGGGDTQISQRSESERDENCVMSCCICVNRMKTQPERRKVRKGGKRECDADFGTADYGGEFMVRKKRRVNEIHASGEMRETIEYKGGNTVCTHG